MSEYIPEPKYLGGKLKVKIDLFNYAKSNLIHQNLLKSLIYLI